MKPGSPEFKELKRDTSSYVDQMKAKAESKKTAREKALRKTAQTAEQGTYRERGKGQGTRNKGQLSA